VNKVNPESIEDQRNQIIRSLHVECSKPDDVTVLDETGVLIGCYRTAQSALDNAFGPGCKLFLPPGKHSFNKRTDLQINFTDKTITIVEEGMGSIDYE